MKIITKGKLKREQIKNIKEIEEVVGGKISNFNIVKIDLENGRYANIIAYLDSMRGTVTVSIQEIGVLTKEIFVEEIYHIHQGEYGMEIVPDKCIDEEYIAKDMFDNYKKYQFIIDKIALETFEVNK